MLLTVLYSPELNVYVVNNGHAERIITPDEFAPGGRYHSVADAFRAAKDAVESGRAAGGIGVEL